MCTGEMKYVILRIDTHVLRIDLCPRKRTRIRRQNQDEDVHLFLSERKKARPQLRQGPSLTPRRSWPRTRQTWQASLTPRKVSNKLFQGFRGLGKAQTSCFKVSDASERLKQVVSRNPRPRKGSNKLFQGFRRVGKAQTSCFKVSDASGRLRTPANLAGASADAGEFGLVPEGTRLNISTGPQAPTNQHQTGLRARMGRTRPGCRPGGP